MPDLNECTRTLWGSSQTFRPYLVEAVWGDGQQYLKVWPMAYRPRFYVVRIDSRVSFDARDEDPFLEDLDGVFEAIEDEVGTCCEDSSACSCNGHEVWPRFTHSTWDGWCWDRMSNSERQVLIP